MARPKGNKARWPVNLWVTPGEREQIKREATDSGLPVASYLMFALRRLRDPGLIIEEDQFSGAANACALIEHIQDNASMTLADYFEKVYWPVRSDPNSEIGVAENTLKNEDLFWRHTGRSQTGEKKEKRGILDGVLGRTRLKDLTDPLWHSWMMAQEHLSPRSKALRRNCYANLLGYARRQGHITYRPEFFRIRGTSSTTRPKEDSLSLDELMALMNSAPSLSRRAMWASAGGVGLRPSELVQVEWPDVSWDDRVLVVRETRERKVPIPIPPIMFDELQALWEFEGNPESGQCWPYASTSTGQYKKALRSDATKAGIERPVTPFLLRASFPTIAWESGMTLDTARQIWRSKSDGALRRAYCRSR